MIRLTHLILPLILSLLAVFAVYRGWFSSLDYYIYDRVQTYNKVPAQDDVLIVAIDEYSTAQLGRWPWPRKRHAELLEVLTNAGSRAVVFDILFGESDRLQPENDIAFARAIKRNGRVILPVHFESLSYQGQSVEIPPIAQFSEYAAAIGHAHVDCSIEGVCRSVYLKEGVGSAHWPHLALALHNFIQSTSDPVDLPKDGSNLPGLRAEKLNRYSPIRIYRDFKSFVPFASKGDIPILSYSDVLSRKIPAALLKDKIVFVGATATGIHDVVATPSGRMPGVKLNSFVYQAIRTDKLSREIGPFTTASITFVWVFALLARFSFLRPSYFLLLTAVSVVMTVFISTSLLLNYNLWFPPVAAMVSIVVFYPLWSWAKIEFALRFLHRSLLRIQAEEKRGELYQLQSEEEFMLPSNERLSKILFGAHFSVESQLRGTEVVTKTIEQFRLANRGLESARQLVLQSLANLQEAVIIFNKSGALVLKNKYAHALFPAMDATFTVEDLGANLVLRRKQEWSEVVRELLEVKTAINLEGYIDEPESRNGAHVDLYIQGRNIVISRPSSNDESSTATTNILLFTFTDITTLKNSERSRMETLDFISHDLRSPMVSIVALIEKQRMSAGENAHSLEVLEQIEKYANRNLGYAESLLHLSRAEVISADNYTTNDMHSIVDNAYMHAMPMAQQKKIALHVDRDDVDMWVTADTDLIERAVINLITNAIKYSGENTQVNVQLKVSAGLVHVYVLDEGPGISEQDQARLFQRFKRGVIQSGKDGAGLGLFFVKTVADRHGGTISMKNNPSGGATFLLSLPLLSLTEPLE